MVSALNALRWLLQALEALAAPVEEQIEWVGPAHPDELALDFDDAFRLLPMLRTEHNIVFSSEALDLLRRLDAMLTAMRSPAQADLWTLEALRTNERWVEVRSLARQASRMAFPLDDESPPERCRSGDGKGAR